MNYQIDIVLRHMATVEAAMKNLREALTDLTTQTNQTKENNK